MEVRDGVAQERRRDDGVRDAGARFHRLAFRDGRQGGTADPHLPRRAARIRFHREEVAYTVTDGDGHTATGTVIVRTGTNPTFPLPVGLRIDATPEAHLLSAFGARGQSYRLQYSPAVTGPWTDFATNVIGADGDSQNPGLPGA